jgi:putative acetyltransferase
MGRALTVDPTGYLDQIVVAPQAWGVADLLIAEAKRLSPNGLKLHVNVKNARAIGFYRKHHFTLAGHDTNPRSGAAVLLMDWRGSGEDPSGTRPPASRKRA